MTSTRRSKSGPRFLELRVLLEAFLTDRICTEDSYARSVASQLQNVLEKCDTITYEEKGTAEAYALLHFLDRFHRFQLTFQRLHALNLMPIKKRTIDILDVGTGPGPSMFAASDFYVDVLGTGATLDERWGNQGFAIDYVEKSKAFRQWLHHFTEYVNVANRSGRPWWVPYHHGTFDDFKDLSFTSTRSETEYDDDGDRITVPVTTKYRYDLIVLSNFLTTKDQVQRYSKELKDCARYLRHNGIMLVVGARRTDRKYDEVYEALSRLITETNYDNQKLVAKCVAVNIGDPVMRYSWSDSYGKRLKLLTKNVYALLQERAQEAIPRKVGTKLENSVHPDYARKIEWQMFVFKKIARPRKLVPQPWLKRGVKRVETGRPGAAPLSPG